MSLFTIRLKVNAYFVHPIPRVKRLLLHVENSKICDNTHLVLKSRTVLCLNSIIHKKPEFN